MPSSRIPWSRLTPFSAPTMESLSPLLEPPRRLKNQVRELQKHRHMARARRRWRQQQCSSSPIILYDYPQIAPESAGISSTRPRSTKSLPAHSHPHRRRRRRDAAIRRSRPRHPRAHREHARRAIHEAPRNPARPTPPQRRRRNERMGMESPRRQSRRSISRNRRQPLSRLGAACACIPKKAATFSTSRCAGRSRSSKASKKTTRVSARLRRLEDDPGRDLGMMRQPGHRFFFTPAEVEPLIDSPHTRLGVVHSLQARQTRTFSSPASATSSSATTDLASKLSAA